MVSLWYESWCWFLFSPFWSNQWITKWWAKWVGMSTTNTIHLYAYSKFVVITFVKKSELWILVGEDPGEKRREKKEEKEKKGGEGFLAAVILPFSPVKLSLLMLFTNFVNFLKNNRETEYLIAKRNDKPSIHYKNGGLIFNPFFFFFFFFFDYVVRLLIFCFILLI